MNCFNHHDAAAVAICRVCGKALCPHCAVDSDAGISCTKECRDKLRGLDQLMSSYESAIHQINSIVEATAQNIIRGSLLWGFAFLVFGILFVDSVIIGNPNYFVLGAAVIGFIMVFQASLSAKRWRSLKK